MSAETPFDVLDNSSQRLSWGRFAAELGKWKADEKVSDELDADLIGLRLRAGGESPWGTHFGPSVFFERDGKSFGSPPKEALTPEILEVWKRRACEAKHPFLRYWYADLVWDLAKLVSNKHPGPEFARLAIDAVVAGLKENAFEHTSEALGFAERALGLSQSLRDQDRAKSVASALITYERSHGAWGRAFDLFVESKSDLVSESERLDIIQDLEAQLDKFTRVQPGCLDPHAAELAALALARLYRKTQQRSELERVLKKYAGAMRAAASMASGMVGRTWLEKAHQILTQFGLKGEADALEPELHKHGERSTKELVKYESEMSLSKEELDALVEQLSNPREKALWNLVVEFLPSPEDAEQEVKDLAKTSVLWASLSKRLMDRDGRTVAVIGSVESDLKGHVVHHIAQQLQDIAFPLHLVLKAFAERGLFDVAKVMELVEASPAFRSDQRAIVEQGLRFYAAEDYCAALHLLVPQIEMAVRELARQIEIPVYKPNERKLLDLRLLHDLLRDSSWIEFFGPRISMYLEIVLVDPRGWNLRNNLCHGLIAANQFQYAFADRTILILLLLAFVARPNRSESAPA